MDGYGGIRNFLHGTALGRKMVDVFWSVLGGDVLALNKYDAHPETAKLKPWLPAMYSGTSFSILNYDTDFFQLVRDGKIRVHVADITHLSPGKVHLSDGLQLKADVLLANTGWKHVPPIRFLPEGIDRELGLPHASPFSDDDLCQPDRLAQADAQILATFPRLRDEPVWNTHYAPLTNDDDGDNGNPSNTTTAPDAAAAAALTPFVLHRFMVPPSARFLRTRDVAFVGSVANFSNIITAHVQGLWVAAYFAGRVRGLAPSGQDLAVGGGDGGGGDDGGLDLERIRREALLHNRFGRWRYPVDWGSRAPTFIFDAVPYLDMLLRDLGLETRRKGGVFAELFSPYGPEDYQGVNEEWAAAEARA